MFHHLRPSLKRHTSLEAAASALHALLAEEGGAGLLGVIEEEDEEEERRGEGASFLKS